MFNKDKSISFWDEVAQEWIERAYAKDDNYSVFPSAQIRNMVLVENFLKQFDKSQSILDIGCADGELIIDLRKAGFTNLSGIDNAAEMIKVSKSRYALQFPEEDQDNIFYVDDADSLNLKASFDIITAIGLIEYLEDRVSFFKTINNLLKDDGSIFIESRNRLFNVFSANNYTKNTKDISDLIDEINLLSSRMDASNLKNSIIEFLSSINNDITSISQDVETKVFKSYPFQLPQLTPSELTTELEMAGFKVKRIHFYHAHIFPPAYGEKIPHLFNSIGVKMQALANTPLGPLICSAFIAEAHKAVSV